MELHIFDFDNTLCRTPVDTPENRRLYEDATGLPWLIDKKLAVELSKKHGRHIGMRRGWYGRPETLEPPLVPEPCPQDKFVRSVCKEFRDSKSNPNSMTVMMTGRHRGLKDHVLRICADGGLITVQRVGSRVHNADPDVQCYFLGDDGPCPKKAGTKPPDTLPWKCWIIKQYLTLYPEIKSVAIWEDRIEHVVAFRDLDLRCPVQVHHVRPSVDD